MSGSDNEENISPGWDELISLKLAAEISGLSYSHMRRLAKKGEIWAIKPGNTWLTTEQAVREYLARDRRPGPKTKPDSRSSS